MLLSQQQNTLDLLQRAFMESCKPPTTPTTTTVSLTSTDGELLENPTLYRSLVGGLQCLTRTRPNIALAVNKVCQFIATPTILLQ